MIRRNGAQSWRNVHITEETAVEDLIDIDNSSASGVITPGFDFLRQAASELDTIVQQAEQQGKRVRALGSGWALTDIAVTDGWLINTKLLNGCFELSDNFFAATYPQSKRPYVVVAQCGISIGELNIYLETMRTPARALKTSGIGAGQTIAGAISGNTHGSAINFGATPDYVVGIQLVTGTGRSVWIERQSYSVLNDDFVNALGAVAIRNDDIFNSAVVSFGAFGVIAAVALETDPIYQLDFAPVNDISHDDLKNKLNNFDFSSPQGLYHYEFIFDPYSASQKAMEAVATKVKFEAGHSAPNPVWVVRLSNGLAPGDQAAKAFFALPIPPSEKTAFQFEQYRQKCILGNVRATPGQVFTATVTYLEGYMESALGVSISDAAKMIEISTDVIQQMGLPVMSQVRVVHPSAALLSFTYLGPKTAIFEFGLANDSSVAQFEANLTAALAAEGVGYTFHWSKNSGITPERLSTMYGQERITRWLTSRKAVFENDAGLMKVFENEHLVKAGLA